MKAVVVNNHCDSRDITIPGSSRTIRIPAFASIDVVLASEEQMRGFAEALAKKAPAAQLMIVTTDAAATKQNATVAENDSEPPVAAVTPDQAILPSITPDTPQPFEAEPEPCAPSVFEALPHEVITTSQQVHDNVEATLPKKIKKKRGKS